MNVLITGGSGFIGSRVADELRAAGHDVLVMDKVPNRNHRTHIADVRQVDALIEASRGIDAIYHLAAEHRDNVSPVSLYHDVNVQGSGNVAAAATRTGVKRIIFTSTVAVYGLQNPSAKEDSEPQPFNSYGESKLQAERLLTSWALADSERSLTIVRPCVVFGEGNRGNVHNLLRQLSSGRFLMIGRGNNRKSLAYVGNVSRFLVGLLDAPPGVTTLNYADKPDLSTAELVRLMRKHLGEASSPPFSIPLWAGLLIGYAFDGLSYVMARDLPISSIRVKKFCAETSVSTARLDGRGFRPPYGMEEGLERTIRADFPTGTVSK